MRRNFKTIGKLLLLAAFTLILTILVFNISRKETYSNLRKNTENRIAQISHLPVSISQHISDFHFIYGDAEVFKRDSFEDPSSLGQYGKPAYLPENHNVTKFNELFAANGFNGLLSDAISLNRALPDLRHFECRYKQYNRNLPTVTVVIPFYNEHLSTLLRTVTSALRRSRSSLIKEIILVDDFSTKESLGKKLEEKITGISSIVRIIRLNQRSGLIRARLAGAREAKEEVLVFLDSHIEANDNWLKPLLDPISKSSLTCVCPLIDIIDYHTFEYRSQDDGGRGAFDWYFNYKRLPLLPEDLVHPIEPFNSPVMTGGLFAINREFFWKLGGYDKGLDIWGGEQYELSFKIWMCGGKIVDAPCSRVGHVFRKFSPFPYPNTGFIARNYKRVASVWMDEYQTFLYAKRPNYGVVTTGPILQQKLLRAQLKCKSFAWFMDNIAFDLLINFPIFDDSFFIAYGQIESLSNPGLCVNINTIERKSILNIASCVSSHFQTFSFTRKSDVRPENSFLCWETIHKKEEVALISLESCHEQGGEQFMQFKRAFNTLENSRGFCMEIEAENSRLTMAKCSGENTQKWRINGFQHDGNLEH